MAPAVRRLADEIRRVDWSQLAPQTGLRCAVGVTIPLVIGVVIGKPAGGVAAAAGALSVGFASLQGVYRTRVVVIVVTTVGMALSTFVGALAAQWDWLVIPLTGLWGFVAGLFVALGTSATVIGLQWTVGLIVVSQFSMSVHDALIRAGLVLAGGLLQMVLVVAVWPLRTGRAERTALAAGYRSLAAYARRVPRHEGRLLPDTDSLTAAAQTLADANPWSDRSRLERYRQLLDEAERIRIELTALADTRQRFLDDASPRRQVDELLGSAAAVLQSVADDLDPPGPLGRHLPARRTVDRLAVPPRAPTETVAVGHPLEGQLRAAVRIVSSLDSKEDALDSHGDSREGAGESRPAPSLGAPPLSRAPSRRPAVPIRGPLLTLRANLDLRSEPCRHAVRLAVTLTAASLVYRAIPVQRGYWTALTVLVVLKPDFTATVARGLGRILGTAVGAVLATVVAAELQPGPPALVGLTAALALASYAVLRVNYTAFAVCLTALVVFLLSLVGLPTSTAVTDRLIDTVAGGLLALVAYSVWPTWEGSAVRGKLATLLESQSRYGTAVLHAYADPAARDPVRLRDALVTARLARSNAQASLDRLLGEPARYRILPDVAMGVVAAIQRYAQAALTLHAYVPAVEEPGVPEVRPLAEQLDTGLRALAGAVAAAQPPAALPPLRDTQLALAREVRETEAHGLAPVTGQILATETDAMVDAVDTVAHVLEQR